MRHFYIFFICFFIIGCDFKTAYDYFIEAEKLEDREQYKEAILLLDKAIQKDEKLLGAYINRGADKSALGNYEEAIIDYKKALSIDIDNTMALVNIGNNYKRLKDYYQAIDYYNQAFETKGGQILYLDLEQNNILPNSNYDVPGYEIHYERAVAYYYIDSIMRSYYDFSAALKNNYLPANCYYWFGLIYLSTGQKDFACESFTKSKQLGNQDAIEKIQLHCKDKN